MSQVRESWIEAWPGDPCRQDVLGACLASVGEAWVDDQDRHFAGGYLVYRLEARRRQREAEARWDRAQVTRMERQAAWWEQRAWNSVKVLGISTMKVEQRT